MCEFDFRSRSRLIVILVMMILIGNTVMAQGITEEPDIKDPVALAKLVDREFADFKADLIAKVDEKKVRIPVYCNEHPDEVMPFLAKYLTDKNMEVRWAVEKIAASSTNPEAVL